MPELFINDANINTFIDGCFHCQQLWLEPNELEQLKTKKISKAEMGVKQPVALKPKALIEYVNEKNKKSDLEKEPDQTWKYIPALFGLPVPEKSHYFTTLPLITLSIALLMVVATVFSLEGKESILHGWSFIPSQFERKYFSTWFSSFFIHGSYYHLLINVYFFLFAGNLIEYILSYRDYLIFLFSAHLISRLALLAFFPESEKYHVGASAGISALLICYTLFNPKARIGILPTRLIYITGKIFWIWVPLYIFVGAWVVMQFYGLFFVSNSSIGYLSHIVGIVIGVVGWGMYRNRYIIAG